MTENKIIEKKSIKKTADKGLEVRREIEMKHRVSKYPARRMGRLLTGFQNIRRAEWAVCFLPAAYIGYFPENYLEGNGKDWSALCL